jgi:hypothetical protein
VGRVFLSGKAAPHDHGSAEETEIGFRDVNAVYLLRPVSSQVEAGTAKVICGHFLKDTGLFLPLVKHGDGSDGAVALGAR